MSARCPRCSKPVYFAEEVSAVGKKWHKFCLKCASCRKQLDSTNVTDHRGDIYCKGCYGKQFGPKGYGFAGGASGLSMDTGSPSERTKSNIPATAQAYLAPRTSLDLSNGPEGDANQNHAPMRVSGNQKWGGVDYCPRCNTAVYLAERKQGGGKFYHMGCFTCFNQDCKKKLDSGSLACYGRLFGPKGIGFGIGAGALQMGQ